MSKDDHPPATSVIPFPQGSLDETSLEETGGQRAVIIASYTTPIEAELTRGRLEAYGIVSDLVDLHTVSIGTHLALAIGGVKVRVAEDDVERARELLDTLPPVEIETEQAEDEPSEAAPEELASRALTSSVIGAVFFPPLSLYSLWLVWRALSSEEALPRRARRQAYGAIAFDAFTLSWVTLVLSRL